MTRDRATGFELPRCPRADKLNLSRVLACKGDRCLYAYDYGENWELDIKVLSALDSVGGETLLAGLECLRDGGRLVSLVQPVAGVGKPGREAIYVFVQPSGAQLGQIAALMAAGKLQVRIDKEFPLADAAKAHALIEKGHIAGKLVLSL